MIQLNDTLFAVEVEKFRNKFIIQQYKIAGTFLMETESKELNSYKIKIPNGKYAILGEYIKKDFINIFRI